MAHLNPNVIISMAIFSAVKNAKEKDKSDMDDILFISSLILEIKKAGIDIGDISFRNIPGGVYSDDVITSINLFLESGFAYRDESNTLVVTEEGIRLCQEIIKEALREDTDKVIKIAGELNLNFAHLL